MSPTNDDTWKLILGTLAGGPAALQWGLTQLRKKRLIENTPCSKIRSAAMGLVEIHGRAIPRRVWKGPVSGRDVCWYSCRVEELRRSGKNSHWQTIFSTQSPDFFYVEDETGRLLVDPHDAEIRADDHTANLGTGNREQFDALFASWGISTGGFFGTAPRRVIESSVPVQSPLFVLGDLVRLPNHLDTRQQRFLERIRKLKADPSAMAAADTNHDGVTDASEWDAFRQKQEQEFLRDEIERQKASPETDPLVLRAPAAAPFMISTSSEGDLVRSMAWQAPCLLALGVAVSCLGVYWTLTYGWPLWSVPLIMTAGWFTSGLFTKRKGALSWF